MKFSKIKHFKARTDCKTCLGSGRIDAMEVVFNVKNMDFDIITDDLCPECLTQSREDFQSYLEDREPDYV